MPNPFDSAQMAAGYARSRPAVHPHIIDRLRTRLRGAAPVHALDVGCGAGLSTAALSGVARYVIGIDPSYTMVKGGAAVAPHAHFVTAVAEDLPVRERSVDLMTAAGSLNWVDLPRFFEEVARVLTRDGTLAIYDFGAGRDFREDDRLSQWYAELLRLYPSPPCRAIVPEALELEPYGLRLQSHESIVVGLALDPAFYLDYVMTETNVAEAVRVGVSADDIRDWCRRTLAPIFPETREVLFKAYLVLIDLRHG